MKVKLCRQQCPMENLFSFINVQTRAKWVNTTYKLTNGLSVGVGEWKAIGNGSYARSAWSSRSFYHDQIFQGRGNEMKIQSAVEQWARNHRTFFYCLFVFFLLRNCQSHSHRFINYKYIHGHVFLVITF